VARDDEASAPCDGRRGITQPSARTTNTTAAGSGSGAGRFSHWPHLGGGASSSGISTTAARSPVEGAGTSDADVVVVAAAVAATTTPLPDAAWRPRLWSAVAHPLLQRLQPPAALSMNAASSARTHPTKAP
jgi:hypothetical protein